MISNDKWHLEKFCSEPLENIENYQKAVNDTEHMWECHHRNEICLANQSRLDKGLTTREQLKADGMYYNRPACELIFLRQDEHRALHAMNRKPETTRRMAEASSRRMRGAKRSEEVIRKMAKSLTNHPVTSIPVKMISLVSGKGMLFPSMGEAARWLRQNGYPNATTGRVSECANGHRATAYNATWRYL